MRKSYQLSVASCQFRARRARALATNNWKLATAFTVTELLIVIGILVIVLALAVPAFNLITGSRSVETASNNIASMLARARTEAIGLQQMRGIFFYVDPKTQNVNVALVEQVDKPSVGALSVDVYLDLTGDRDVLSLPVGVSVQVIDDGGSSGSPNDHYLGFNLTAFGVASGAIKTPYGGVILFDARGQLASKSYALRVRRVQPGSAPPVDEFTPMGQLLYDIDPNVSPVPTAQHKDVAPVDPANALKIVRSQLGYVLFDLDAFKNANEGGDAMADLQVVNPGSAYGGFERSKEQWLDKNATAILINRYTGALVKGE